jgi:hypothetical protein
MVDAVSSTVVEAVVGEAVVVEAVVADRLVPSTMKLVLVVAVTLPKADPNLAATPGGFVAENAEPVGLLRNVPPASRAPFLVHPLELGVEMVTVRAVIVPDLAVVPVTDTHVPTTTWAAVAVTVWLITLDLVRITVTCPLVGF